MRRGPAATRETPNGAGDATQTVQPVWPLTDISKRYWVVADQTAGAIASRPGMIRIIVRTMLVLSALQLLAAVAILVQALRVESGAAQAWAITPQGVRVRLETFESAQALREAMPVRQPAAGGSTR